MPVATRLIATLPVAPPPRLVNFPNENPYDVARNVKAEIARLLALGLLTRWPDTRGRSRRCSSI